MPNGEERSLFLVIVQPEEFHEVLILGTQPTGFLQRTSMADQIFADHSRLHFHTSPVDIQRKGIELLPSVLVDGRLRAPLGKVMKQLHSHFHLQRLFLRE